ncbi:hypothetical protein [Chlorogloeopsis sp. ULAP02]
MGDRLLPRFRLEAGNASASGSAFQGGRASNQHSKSETRNKKRE